MEKNIKKDPYYQIKSVEKALKVLEVLAQKEEASLTELSKHLGLTKTNVHRIMRTLHDRGFVITIGDGSKYMLSLKLFILGVSVKQNSVLTRVACKSLETLSSQTKETINLAVLYNDEVLYLHKIVSNESLHIDTPITKSDPAYATALGKCLLCEFKRERLDQYIEKNSPLKYLTRNTITDPLKFLYELDKVKKIGYAIDREEVLEGVRCIAAPIHDSKQHIVAAISITGPSVRMDEEKLRCYKDFIVDAAQEISLEYNKISSLTNCF